MDKKYYDDVAPELKERKWSDSKYNGQTFTTQMDPDSEPTQYPTEYPILSERALRRVDVSYLGNPTDSDNTVAVATLDRDGPLYRTFDVATMPVALQYKGLAIPHGGYGNQPGYITTNQYGYNRSFARSNMTALSAAFATQLTDIAFLTCGYRTNIPGMETGPEAAIGSLVYYQSLVCNIQGIIQGYFNLKAQKDQMVKMGYNAEASRTIELMNLLNKAQIRSLFEQLGTILAENYVDETWMREISVIGNIPSRDYFDMMSPLKVVSAYHVLPTLEIWSSQGAYEAEEPDPDDKLFDSLDPVINKLQITLNLPEGNPYRARIYTLEGLIQHIFDLLNPAMLLGFIRQLYWGTADDVETPLEDYATYMSITAYVNDLICCVDRLITVFGRISTAMVDLKTFLMLLQERTDLNGWLIGSSVAPTDSIRRQVDWFNYELVDHLMRAYFAGGHQFHIDTNTRKWAVSSLWDYDKGIPKFDFREGGMAIASAVRWVDPNIDPTFRPMFDFPVAFVPMARTRCLWLTLESAQPQLIQRSGMAWTRHGEHAHIVRQTVSVAQLRNSPYLSRLEIVPLQNWQELSAPIMVFDNETEPNAVLCANGCRFMATQFGLSGSIGYGGFTAVDSQEPAHRVDDILIKPSETAVGVVTREFDDFPHMAEEYIRKTSPLRISGGPVSLGFLMK